jgi:two-component sensor histidine kinase
MTNSLKYAFPDNKKGAINISLSKGESDINVLHYSDNGIGFPDEFDFRKQSTLGLQLIYGIGEKQMMGKVTMENKNGLVCVFEFQNNLYQARV